MQHEPFILIISSPSGTGKTSLAKKLLEDDSNIEQSISVTTRKARNNEKHGVDYYFIEQEEYQQLLDNNDLLEHAKIYENYYGTPKRYVDNTLEQGKDMLFNIDWQGAKQIKSLLAKRVVSIFILPPSLYELEQRLRNRKTDSEETIIRRLHSARGEINHYIHYKYIIINNDFEQCLNEIKAIIKAERLKRTSYSDFVSQLIKE